MAENPVTFSPDAARRIIRAVKAVEQGGVDGPQHRRMGGDRPSWFQWFGIVGAKSGNKYTVTSCTFSGGTPTAIASGAYGYISKLCYHADAVVSEDGEEVPEIPTGTVVVVYDAWDGTASFPVFWSQTNPSSVGSAAAQITGATIIVDGAKWLYSITFGTYSLAASTQTPTWTMGETTAIAVNTIEANNVDATTTGGDGVALPAAVGTLTRIPVATGAVVLVTQVVAGLYAFTVPNPFTVSCET